MCRALQPFSPPRCVRPRRLESVRIMRAEQARRFRSEEEQRCRSTSMTRVDLDAAGVLCTKKDAGNVRHDVILVAAQYGIVNVER